MAGTSTSTPPATRRSAAGRALRSPVSLWCAFALVHAGLVVAAYYAPNLPLGDVTLVYEKWVAAAFAGHGIIGIDSPFVYPVLAMAPMALAGIFGIGAYFQTWIALVVVLDAVAFWLLVGGFRSPVRRHRAAWWWLAFLALLGPIAIGRIDAVTVPLALIAVLFAAGRPRLSAALLTAAMWMKVWPAALIGALLIASRARVRILVSGVVTSAVIVGIALLLGSGWNVLSFVTEQAGRGLQVEAPIATAWLWRAFAGATDAWVYYDRDILTYQVTGDGTHLAAAVMTPALVLVVGAVIAIGIWAAMRGAPVVSLLPSLALALTLALIVVNKVGSPQFMCWLAAPVLLGVLWRGRRFLVPAIAALVLAALTQAIYPYLYNDVLLGDPVVLSVLTVRNLLEIALFGWAVVATWRAAPARTSIPSLQPRR